MKRETSLHRCGLAVQQRTEKLHLTVKEKWIERITNA